MCWHEGERRRLARTAGQRSLEVAGWLDLLGGKLVASNPARLFCYCGGRKGGRVEGKQDVRDGAVESELSFLYTKQATGEERREYTRRGEKRWVRACSVAKKFVK